MTTKNFTYSIHFGFVLFFIIYLLLFDHVPGGEEGLIYVTPFWLCPIIFGVSGHIGSKLNKPNPTKFAILITIYALAGLAFFFKGIWPML